jgi:DNA-directed RNA polymerase specialized sigma24 family protein
MSTTMTPFLAAALAALETTPIRRLAARMVGADQPDVLADVAVKMIERDRSGKPPPRNVSAYVTVCVRHECLRLLTAAKLARCTPRPDPAMADACPGVFPGAAPDGDDLIPVDAPRETVADVDDMVEHAISRLTPRQREQIRLTYWAEIPVRDTERRGVPYGTAVTSSMRGRERLREMPEIAAAAELLGIGRHQFEPAPGSAWERFAEAKQRTAAGQQLLDTIRVWTTLAGRKMDAGAGLTHALGSTRRTAAAITGADARQVQRAENAIRRFWARAGEGEVAA